MRNIIAVNDPAGLFLLAEKPLCGAHNTTALKNGPKNWCRPAGTRSRIERTGDFRPGLSHAAASRLDSGEVSFTVSSRSASLSPQEWSTRSSLLIRVWRLNDQ